MHTFRIMPMDGAVIGNPDEYFPPARIGKSNDLGRQGACIGDILLKLMATVFAAGGDFEEFYRFQIW
jgi:hypothetical protein